MKVLHLSTTGTRGGAGKATGRLHLALRALGVDSRLLAVEDAGHPAPYHRALDLECAQAVFIDANRTTRSNTLFSLGLPGPDFRSHPDWTAADVIHLHWVSGLLSVPAIGELLGSGKPVVWTLHDQWTLTGGCHYTAGCDHFRHGCPDCPQLATAGDLLPAAVYADKQALWTGRGRLTLVALTAWMETCIRQSGLFARANVERVPNGIDLSTYAPSRRAAARRALGLAEDTLLCLFVSQSIHETRKGFGVLKEALALAARDDAFATAVRSGRLVFASLGHHHDDSTAVPLRALPWADDDAGIADCYAAADLFVAPSLEDNLPNTIVESLACGTPVLATTAGGIPEMINPGRTGTLVAPGDPAALAGALLDFFRQPARHAALRPACRAAAEAQFSAESNARRMLAVYERAVAAAPVPGSQATATPPAPYGPAVAAFLQRPAPALPTSAWTSWAGRLDRELRGLTTALLETRGYLAAVTADRDAGLSSLKFYQEKLQTAYADLERNTECLRQVERARDDANAALNQTVAYLHTVEADSAERLKSIENYQAKLKTAYDDLARNVAYLKMLEAEIEAHRRVGAEREAVIARLSGQNPPPEAPRP